MTTRAKLFSQLARRVDTSGTITSDGISSTVSLGATVYDSIGELPTSGYTAGEQAFVKSTSRLYINSGVGWYNVAVINNTPTIQSVLDSDGGTTPFVLAADGTATTITITAQDSDGDTLTYTAVTDSDFGGLATVSQADNVFTITPFSQDSATTESGTITFNVSDGINIANSVQTFTLNFLSALWDETVLSIGTSSTNSLGNSTFIDRSTNAHTVTPTGSPVQTAFHPYLDKWSVEFDGSGDYLSTSDTIITDYSNGVYTVEAWVMFNSTARSGIVQKPDTYILFLNGSGNIQWGVRSNTASPVWMNVTHTESIEAGVWYHILAIKASNSINVAVNGVFATASSIANGAPGGSHNTIIGVEDEYLFGSPNNYLNGYLSDVRISNSVLYSVNFSVPDSTLSSSASTQLLTCQSNRFIDNSASAHSITVNGNPKVSAFNPFGQESEYAVGENKGSVSLNGTNSGLFTGQTSDLAMGTDDFTVEAWIYVETLGGLRTIFDTRNVYGSEAITFELNNDTLTFFAGSYSSNNAVASSSGIKINQWHHVAFARSSGTNYLFIDGNQVATNTNSFNQTLNTNVNFTIGYSVASGRWVDGYISDFRIVKGTAVYTSNFTPPTAPVGNTNASLYLPMDNAGIFDKTGNHTLTLVGNTSTSTAQTKFADTAVYFDGTGDYLRGFGDLTAMGSGDFTWESWVYFNAFGTYSGIIDSRRSNGAGTGAGLIYVNGTTLTYWSGNSQKIAGSTLSTGQWYHIAAVRNSGTVTLYLNGTSEGSASDSVNMVDRILRIGDTFDNYPLNGYIENLQIIKGVAKYTANFTPPTQTQGKVYQAES